jgi:hypothetical protein
MNRNTYLVAAIAAFASVSSFAEVGEANPAGQYAQPIQSVQTRDAVRADLVAFKKAGVNPWSTSYNQLTGFTSTTDRGQVRADYVAGRDGVAAMTAEDSGSNYRAQPTQGRDAPATLAGSFTPAQ